MSGLPPGSDGDASVDASANSTAAGSSVEPLVHPGTWVPMTTTMAATAMMTGSAICAKGGRDRDRGGRERSVHKVSDLYITIS